MTAEFVQGIIVGASIFAMPIILKVLIVMLRDKNKQFNACIGKRRNTNETNMQYGTGMDYAIYTLKNNGTNE